MADKKLIGTRIKTVRMEMGMNQKNFALSLGYTPSFQSEIEKLGKTPSIDIITRMIKKYNINPLYLLTGEGDHFLQPPKNSVVDFEADTPVLKKAEKEDEIIDKIIWLLLNVPRIRYGIFEAFYAYENKNKEIIDEEIAKIFGNQLEFRGRQVEGTLLPS